MLHIILDNRISKFQYDLNLIIEEKFGCTKNRRTQDPIFILQTLVEQAKVNKEKLFVAFIDFQIAYDFVFQNGLFFKMLRCGLDGRIFKIMHSIYGSVKSVVINGGDASNVIMQTVGLRQG